jgi:phage-related protein
MAKLTPDLDKFTKNLNKTVPSITGGLSDKVRKANTTSAIDGVKDEICDKIGGVVNLASGIISGAIGVFNDAKAILTGENNLSDAIGGAVDSFFEDAKDKINDVTESINNAFDKLKNGELNLAKAAEDQINKLEKELTEKFESVKIAAAGFKDTLTDVKEITNNTVKDILNAPSALANYKGGLCSKAEKDLVDTAVAQKSVTDLTSIQDTVIEKSNKLIDFSKKNVNLIAQTGIEKIETIPGFEKEEYELLENVKQLKDIGVDQTELTKFYKENKTWGDATPLTGEDRFVDVIDPDTGDVIGIEDRVNRVIRPVNYS